MRVSETLRARVATCTLHGVEAIPVSAEIEVGPGLPGMQIVGLADTAVQEARLRVRSALKASGFSMPAERHVVVNLAPASLRKSGSDFDLPIAIAYLVATQQLALEAVRGSMLVGELSLDGEVRTPRALFAYAHAARQQGLRLISGPVESSMPSLDGLEHACLPRLARLKSGAFDRPVYGSLHDRGQMLDFKDVVGQGVAVRALTIAAAGAHGVLMVGPPGSGKSMLASRLPSILPPLSESELVETAIVHSVAGLDLAEVTAGIRPYRSPHHSATSAALVGGGRPVMPGEASLAHNGVLFLDELGEFSVPALQALRQPLEDGRIVLARADGKVAFPAKFQLIAASNPCPCGFLNDRDHTCKCSEAQINRYQGKLGGPLKDRIDLICEVTRVDPAKVLDSGSGTASASLADAVMLARERAARRASAGRALASQVPHELIEECGLGKTQRSLVETMARQHHLSGRGIVRILRVARTIADLEQSDAVKDDHLYESFMYRVENTLE